jgi:uncharacterized phage-associated protein
MTLTPKFNEEKAAQIACLLLKKRGVNRMNYLKLMKLMYLIDREALVRWGVSMTFDRYVSMDNGCVLTQTYNLLVLESYIPSYWKQYISPPQGYDVALLSEPEYDEISQAELELIEEIYENFGHLNRRDLVKLSHELPEWRNPQGSSIPIDYRDVLRLADKTEEEILDILSEMEAVSEFEEISRK